jgi:hypothetical protein
MDIEFLASVAAFAANPKASRSFFLDTPGPPLDQAEGDDYHSEGIEDSKRFGVWPLRQAAQACFTTDERPAEHPVPQASEP